MWFILVLWSDKSQHEFGSCIRTMTSSSDECVINSEDKERAIPTDQSLSLIARLKVAVLHLQQAQSQSVRQLPLNRDSFSTSHPGH